MKFLFIVVAISATAMTTVGAHAAGGTAACYNRSAAMSDRQAQESGKAEETWRKLEKTDSAGACQFGRKNMIPLLERHIVEQKGRMGEICWDDLHEKLLADSQKYLTQYRNDVEADCQKAQTAPTSGDDSLCGGVHTKSYEDGGIKGGNVHERIKVQCIQAENKCSYPVFFSVTRFNTQGNGRTGQTVEPGRVGKICADNDTQSLQFNGAKRSGYIPRR
ncbi:hypothetical protein ML401_16920 [Bradyrhizobium sp. 62B]|uniref:hypothetical protein n=1 Tax=Bradyrhizobium sp. 62B TaxID=2898442 RepID=UPI00255814A7|nr:hypothetical protein ML401_16920 [Bradyrhizobium sp. 62B]